MGRSTTEDEAWRLFAQAFLPPPDTRPKPVTPRDLIERNKTTTISFAGQKTARGDANEG
jgi:hypothetical protein